MKIYSTHTLGILILAVCSYLNLSWQVNTDQSQNYFVQFRVLSIPDLNAADEIDAKMESKKGILSSSADHVTSTYFCVLSPEVVYTKDDFIAWFAKMGYEIACFTKGVQNVDAVVSPHVLKTCEETEQN